MSPWQQEVLNVGGTHTANALMGNSGGCSSSGTSGSLWALAVAPEVEMSIKCPWNTFTTKLGLADENGSTGDSFMPDSRSPAINPNNVECLLTICPPVNMQRKESRDMTYL